MNMTEENATVAVFAKHAQAEDAIDELKRSGFDMNRLSIIGKDFHTEEHVVGYYNTGARMKAWGKMGAFWGGVWGMLVGAAFFSFPGIGPVLVGGFLVNTIVAALEGAFVVGGLSALGAGLYSLGIPKNSVLRYETDLRAGKFLLIAHGTADEIERARDVLERTEASEVHAHRGGHAEAASGAPGIM